MNRRNFMQMLGLGGLALGAPAPLFGSTKLWTPDQRRDLTKGHLVLTRPRISGGYRIRESPIGPAFVPQWPVVRGWAISSVNVEAGVFAREAKVKAYRDPYQLILEDESAWKQPSSEDPEFTLRGLDTNPWLSKGFLDGDLIVEVPITSEIDPHLAFYKGAMKMREDITKNSLQLLTKLPEWRRSQAQIVTVVDNPVFACGVGKEFVERHGCEGLRIETHFTQYIVGGEMYLNGWEVESEFGEYPIEVPSDLDMAMILKLDADAFNGKIPRRELLERDVFRVVS